MPVRVPVLTICPAFKPMPVRDSSLASQASGTIGWSSAATAVPRRRATPLHKSTTSWPAMSRLRQFSIAGP